MAPCLEAGGWGAKAQGMLLPHWHRPCPGLGSAPVLLSVPWAGSGPAEAASSIRVNTQKASAGRDLLSAQGKAEELHCCLIFSNYPCKWKKLWKLETRPVLTYRLPAMAEQRAAWSPWWGHLLLAPLPMVQVHNPELLLFLPLGEIAFAGSTFPSLRVAWKVFQHGNPSMLHIQLKCQQQSCFSPCALDAVCREPEHLWDHYPVPPNLPPKHEAV